MPSSVAKKPRHVFALQVARQSLDDEHGTARSLFNDAEYNFLKRFLFHRQVKRLLELFDELTVGTQCIPRLTSLRPENQEDRDSLHVLSDLWSDLESFVMKTREEDQPDAHELYDLLADPYIRELLVAYDDIANYRFASEDLDLVPLYSEPEPATKHANSEMVIHERKHKPADLDPPDENTSNGRIKGSLQPADSGIVSRLVDRFETQQPDRRSSSKTSLQSKSIRSRESKSHSREEDSWESVTSLTVGKNSSSHVGASPGHNMRPERMSDTLIDEELSEETLKPISRNPPKSERRESHNRIQLNEPAKMVASDSEATPSSPTKKASQAIPNPSRAYSHYPSSSLPNRSKRHSRDTTASNVQSLSSRRVARSSLKENRGQPGQVRRVSLRREHPGEPIGITLAVRTPSPPQTGHDSQSKSSVLAIQRVMAGSLADRKGSLFPGDIVLEFNGRPVQTLDEVYTLIKQSSGALECDFLVQTPQNNGILSPGSQCKSNPPNKRYIRTFFDYNATQDALMPTGDVGLSFKAGEVLELINDQDPNWWQVRRLDDPNGRARLIPSQTLEERRTAFKQDKPTSPATKFFKKRYKRFFRAADSSELRLRADLWSYEEVVPWPHSKIPCLLLLGVTGVGRRNLKVLLVNADPNRFAFPVTCTTDPSASSNHFQLVSKAQMQDDVRAGAYVEWGKANGHYYGIQFKAIRKIIATGRTAVLDCQPQTVHLLHQPEFNPCVVFIGAPDIGVAQRMMEDGLRSGVTTVKRTEAQLREMIEESKQFATRNRHLYFQSLVNSNMHETVDKLIRLVNRIERQPCWIPSGWAYELSVPVGSVPGGTFVPGSSSLSALGIHGLPPARASTIARSVISGISEASADSAKRLANPPSILSAPRDSATRGQRKYEGHRRSQINFRPLSPTIPEQDTPTDSVTSRSATAKLGGIRVLPPSPNLAVSPGSRERHGKSPDVPLVASTSPDNRSFTRTHAYPPPLPAVGTSGKSARTVHSQKLPHNRPVESNANSSTDSDDDYDESSEDSG